MTIKKSKFTCVKKDQICSSEDHINLSADGINIGQKQIQTLNKGKKYTFI